MADAMCGPSNALQSFKQHSSVDRSIQQDRLISRQNQGQGFRSHDPNTGILDHEFEAFQAGQPSAFAGPAFPPQDHFTPLQHAKFTQHAAPIHHAPAQAAPAWASDFQNLHISSPLHGQQSSQPRNAAWANQFQQTAAKSPVHGGYASPAMQYNNSPSFAMNRAYMGGFQQPTFQSPLQQSHQVQAQPPKQDFDEAAFDAAFDAAMEDAFSAHDQVEESSRTMEDATRTPHVDIYPQIPLLRLALLRAIMDGSDRLLNEAALFVHHLDRYDVVKIDPVQAMLLRPLLNSLADESRSPFAQRYQISPLLARLTSRLEAVEKNAHISPENEQLLAAYADCLWGRDQSAYPRQPSNLNADPSYWKVLLEESMDSWHDNTPTDQAMKMLSQTNLFGMAVPESMQRVQDLEVKAYQDRPYFQNYHERLPSAGNPQDLLFNMATILRRDPELQQATLTTEQQTGQLNRDPATADYLAQLNLLETQNRQFSQTKQQEADLSHMREEAAIDKQAEQDTYGEFHEDHRWHENNMEPEQREQLNPPTKDDDELANTAAELLNKVSHDKSSKFQNSAFLGLMRKLADREVKVEGDKMVEVSCLQCSITHSAH